MDDIVINWSELQGRLVVSIGGWSIGAYRTREQADHAAQAWIQNNQTLRPLTLVRQPFTTDARRDTRDTREVA